jgi:hypothetical protein
VEANDTIFFTGTFDLVVEDTSNSYIGEIAIVWISHEGPLLLQDSLRGIGKSSQELVVQVVV